MVEARAKYGNRLIKEYSIRLTKELGKGYTDRNLRNMRSFYIKFKKWHAVRAELSWTHYRYLLPLNDIKEINIILIFRYPKIFHLENLRKE